MPARCRSSRCSGAARSIPPAWWRADSLPPVVAALGPKQCGPDLTWDRIAPGVRWRPRGRRRLAVARVARGGAAGPGRMRFVGPFTRDVLVHAVTACGVGALLGASVLAWFAWRAALTLPAEQPHPDTGAVVED